MKGAAAVLRFLLEAHGRGERVALVTLSDVIGRASRAPGTQMAVSETGVYRGSFSGGCVEAAVVGEAKRIIDSGTAESVRFGDGSPYFDIKLPCGGGIDLMITPQPSSAEIARALDLLEARDPALITIHRDGTIAVDHTAEADRTGWIDDAFRVRHDPDMQVIVVGHGEETRALAVLGSSYGARIVALSPDRILVDELSNLGIGAHHLLTPGPSPWLKADRYTAVVMLFHDHDWETDLLAQALQQDAFFVGAMGSRTTHMTRMENLLHHGVSAEAIGRLVGPIGLIPATRDPETLALSALSQIAMCYEQACESSALEFYRTGEQQN